MVDRQKKEQDGNAEDAHEEDPGRKKEKPGKPDGRLRTAADLFGEVLPHARYTGGHRDDEESLDPDGRQESDAQEEEGSGGRHRLQ